MSGIGGHHSARYRTADWLTPPEVLDPLGPFDLDPCASRWQMEGKLPPTAARMIGPPSDGLSRKWEGRVWLNPPYGRHVWRWLGRLADHGQGTALVFARVEVEGFFRTAWTFASAMLFLDGRLTFLLPDGRRAPANSGGPSVLVAYGIEDARRLRESGLPGAYVDSWEVHGPRAR